MPTIAEALNTALGHHQRGELQPAESIYRQILAVEPRNADALHLLGYLAYQMGRADIAIDHIRQAIEINPNFSVYHSNLGLVLRSLGNIDAALASYTRAFEIDPKSAEACNNLAIAHADRREMDKAIEWYKRAIAINPEYAEAHNNLGNVYSQIGEVDQSISSYEKAIRLRPNFAEAHDNLGVVLAQCGEIDDAVTCFKNAIEYNPTLAQPYNNLGNALSALGRQAEAIKSFNKALELRHNFPEAMSNLANSLTNTGYPEEAIALTKRSLEIRPKYSGALSNMGMAMQHCGNVDDAFKAFEKALHIEPTNAGYQFNHALNLLLRGEFDRGWDAYECRFNQKSARPLTPIPKQSTWAGEDLHGKSILILPEQGLGDVIQFSRYATMLKDAGAEVTLQVQHSLIRLIKSLEGVDRVIDINAEQPATDYVIHVMSMPRVFKTRLESIPRKVPYLHPMLEDVEAWKSRVAQMPAGFKVGLVWTGSRVHAADHFRSISLSTLDPLADLENVQFISLQKERRDEPASKMSARLIDPTNDLNDLADSAALIANLDLVISVDTSIVHLAGAIGKPAWVLLHAGPDFRWLMNREDSPWYPTVRLFRQSRIKEWSPVIERMRSELGKLSHIFA